MRNQLAKILKIMMCIILPCVVLFTSCGKDEPSNKPEAGGGTVKPPSNNHDFKYYFTAGGVKYDYYRPHDYAFNSSASEYWTRNLIELKVAGMSEGYNGLPTNNRTVACSFCIESFNYKSANPGTLLHIIESDMFDSYLNYKRFGDGSVDRIENYGWGGVAPNGSVKFISFANNILTLEVNITMNDGNAYNPTFVTLYGTIHYDMNGTCWER